jgi:hypothetical protein
MDIKSGRFHLTFGSAENVLDTECSVDALKYSSCHLRNRLVAFVIDESHVIETCGLEKGKYKFKMHILFPCMSRIIFQTILYLSHKQSRYFAKDLQNYLALLLA